MRSDSLKVLALGALLATIALTWLLIGQVGDISAVQMVSATRTPKPLLGPTPSTPTPPSGSGAAITLPPPATSTQPVAAPFLTMTAMLGNYATPTPRPPTTIEATGRPQFLYFHAYWCGPCREMRPIIRRLEDDYWLLVDFHYLNVDESANRNLLLQYRIRFVPTIVLLDEDGRVADVFIGYTDERVLRRALERLLPKGIESI